MPNKIYMAGKVWCSVCCEKRDPTPNNFCYECRHKMRTNTRTRKGKESLNAYLALRE